MFKKLTKAMILMVLTLVLGITSVNTGVSPQRVDAATKIQKKATKAYAKILKKYYTAYTGVKNNSYYDTSQMNISSEFNIWCYGNSKLVYRIIDWNSDKIPELFIGVKDSYGNLNLADSYTYRNGKAKRLLIGEERQGRLGLLKGGKLSYYESGSAWDFSYKRYKIAKKTGKLKKTIVLGSKYSRTAKNNASYYKIVNKKKTHISYSKYKKLYKKYFKKKKIKFKKCTASVINKYLGISDSSSGSTSDSTSDYDFEDVDTTNENSIIEAFKNYYDYESKEGDRFVFLKMGYDSIPECIVTDENNKRYFLFYYDGVMQKVSPQIDLGYPVDIIYRPNGGIFYFSTENESQSHMVREYNWICDSDSYSSEGEVVSDGICEKIINNGVEEYYVGDTKYDDIEGYEMFEGRLDNSFVNAPDYSDCYSSIDEAWQAAMD